MHTHDLNKEFNFIIKNIISPIYSLEGFKKSGNNFYRVINQIGQAFGIGQSQWNTKDEKKFWFEIGLIDSESYTEIYNKPIPKFPKSYQCNIRFRFPEEYNLSQNDTDFQQIQKKIKMDIEEEIIPYYKKYSNFETLIEIFEDQKEIFTNPIVKFMILERINQKEKAQIFWNKLYNKSLQDKEKILLNKSKFSESELQSISDSIKWYSDFAKKKNIELKIDKKNFIKKIFNL